MEMIEETKSSEGLFQQLCLIKGFQSLELTLLYEAEETMASSLDMWISTVALLCGFQFLGIWDKFNRDAALQNWMKGV